MTRIMQKQFVFATVLVLATIGGLSRADEAENLLRFRLMRAREQALMTQKESILMPLLAASGKLSENWDAVSHEKKIEIAAEAEKKLALPPITVLPESYKSRQIPFAVPCRRFRDVQYSTIDGVDAKSLSYDAYAPMDAKDCPIVVWVHGGGFVGGDKAHPLLSVMKPDYFVSEGYVFVSVNYRLAPKHKFPSQGNDMAAALSHLHDHASDYSGDQKKIFLIGDSAGAQLVSIVSTNVAFLGRNQKSLSVIRGTVMLDIGSFDVPAVRDALGDNVPKQYKDLFNDNRDEWVAASPMLNIDKDKGIPPMLLIHVSGREHHKQENNRFAKRLHQYGYVADVFEAQDRTHHTLAYNIGVNGDAATERIMTFISALLAEHR
jgi:acetyl esterase/lipase